MTAMAGIFINYRRDDSPGVAGRLFDHLALTYSRRGIFMDVDAMKPGVDFARQLETQVSQCRVLLAVIGPRWLDAKDQAGKRRLDNDNDYVRIELASALKRDIPVIPVLVDGAVMPSEDSLSEDLKPLVRRHALELRHSRFNADADAIALALDEVVPRRRVPWVLVGAGAAVVVVAAAVAVLWPKLSHKPVTPPAVVAVTPGPVNPPAVSPPPAQPAAPGNSATPSGLPAGAKLGEMLRGINLMGSTLRTVDIPQDDPANCQAACRAESHCAAWTYVPSNGVTQPGRCALKAVIPDQVASNCCTSAIERAPELELREAPPVPATVTGALRGVDMFGGEYRAIIGPQATPEACQTSCKADALCMAWTYIRPGIVGSDPRCLFKGRIIAQVHSNCCISAIERQAAVNPPPAAASAPAQPSPPAASTSAAPAGGLPAGTKLGEIMKGVTFRGSVLRVTEIPADPANCQAACRAETHCAVWTYSQPKAPDQPAHCSLKPVIPEPITDACCTSAIERLPDPELRQPPPIPAGMSGAVPGIELEGGTYRYFGGADATLQGCQAACRADGQCLAWDYVRPGIYSPDARCFLKNKGSIQVKSACCVAGFER
jgi:hypothetical protein